LDLQAIVKSGAISSTIGVALLITFVIVLLAFPLLKECQNFGEKKCEFYSSAPEPLKFILKPIFLVIALIVIAIGVIIIRVGTWYVCRKN
jgi:hypothetical protein